MPGERSIVIYRDWSGSEFFKYFKTRTALLRSPTGEVVAWGNEALISNGLSSRSGNPDNLQLSEGFKLNLTSDDRALRGHAVKDSTDFLRLMRQKALQVIQDYGLSIPEEKIRWCITIPAMVNDLESFDSMLRAAVAQPAGFPATDRERLVIALEPEVAALYCYFQREGADFWLPGSRFAVIDAGGGTVDITTFAVRDDYSLDQIGFRAGGKLGSRFLNERFFGLVWKRLEEKLGWEEDASPNFDDWEMIRTNWEQDKRFWDLAGRSMYRVRIPRRAAGKSRRVVATALDASEHHGDGDLTLSGEDILGDVFEPVVSGIVNSFGEALTDLPEGPPISQVLLVGGFGGSPYLQHRIEEYLSSAAPLRTLPDPRSAEAVLRGAVHYALDPKSIHARRLQYTYGLEISGVCRKPGEQHDKAHYYARYSFWDSLFDRQIEVCDQLLVFATRGELIEAGTERDVGPLYTIDYKMPVTHFQLFASEDADPYFVESCIFMGRIEVPTRIPRWRSSLHYPFDVKVSLGDTELVFYARDKRRSGTYQEIKLRYLEANADRDNS